VVVLTDSGYDNKKIETAIANKRWNFIIALGKTGCVPPFTHDVLPGLCGSLCHPCFMNPAR